MEKLRARITPKGNFGHLPMICNADNVDMIYNKLMRLTNGNEETSSTASIWCSGATVGEIFEFENGYIEIEKLKPIK